MRYRETFIIKHGERLILKGVDPAGKQHHESELGAKDEIEHYRSQLAKLQSLLYAEKKRSILVVLQAMDAGGKDGVVNHVLSVLKPTSFRDPRLGRSATNCRSRRFEATVAIWRSPSSFGRRRRRGRARRPASASTARSGADRIRHRPPAGLARHAVLHRFDRRQGSLPSPAAQQLTAGECRARSVSR